MPQLSLEDALSSQEVEVAFICSESSSHEDYIRQFLNAGKHVLVEYPMTPSWVAAKDLWELVEQKGKVLHEEHVELLMEEFAFLKKEVERLKDELVRMVSRNLDLSERLEWDVELRRRTQVAREIMEGHVERQRNADLQDAIGMSPVEYRLMITRDF